MGIIHIAHADVIAEAPSFATIGGRILFFLLSIIGVIAIIMALVNGLRYFLAMGNESQLKDAKKSFAWWTVGVALAMGSLVVVKFFGQFF